MSHVARVLLSTAFAALGVLGARFASGADATPADAPTESSATSTTTTTARRTYVPRAPLVNPVGSTTESGAPGPPTAVSESAPVPLEAPPGSEQALGEAPPSEPAPSSALSESAAAALPITKRSARPGQRVAASGTGCPPGAQVGLTIGDRPAGSVTADANGDFSAPLRLPTLAPGRHKVAATCGVVLSPPLEVFVSSSVETPASSTLAVMNFVILLGVVLLTRGRTPRRQGARSG